jgi:pyruvate kinase
VALQKEGPLSTMRRNRQAKIVATLGPASSSPEVIRALFDAGADVFRFNFSHGSHEEHRRRHAIVRNIEHETGRPIAVLADLQGPKLRVGTLAAGPIALVEGERLRFDLDNKPGDRGRVSLPRPEVFRRSPRGCSFCSMTARSGSRSRTPERNSPRSACWSADNSLSARG